MPGTDRHDPVRELSDGVHDPVRELPEGARLELARVMRARAAWQAQAERQRAAYDRFATAVGRAVRSGVPVVAIARALGISRQRVHQIIQEHDVRGGRYG
jgi:DNA invertase Pin-like site-specific DNA recombinase